MQWATDSVSSSSQSSRNLPPGRQRRIGGHKRRLRGKHQEKADGSVQKGNERRRLHSVEVPVLYKHRIAMTPICWWARHPATATIWTLVR